MPNVFSFLVNSAEKHPQKVCIKGKDIEWTFSEVYQKALRLAGKLRSTSVKPGDRVMIYLDNSVEYAAALFAVFCVNAIAVPVNKDLSVNNLRHIYNETEPKVIMSNKLLMSRLEDNADIQGCIFLGVDFIDEAAHCLYKGREDTGTAYGATTTEATGKVYCNPVAAIPEADDSAPAMIIYTSGTTKLPKGVTLTHRNLFANTVSILQYLKLTHEDSVLATISFTYSYGSSVLMTHIKAGGTIIIENRSAYPLIVLEQLANTRVTGFSTLGSYLNRLLKQDNIRAEHFEHLHYVTLAGERTNQEDIERLSQLAPHIKIFNMYGQTEACARLSYLEPEMLQEKAGSIGRGIAGVKLRVVTEDGRDVVPGETGEVIACGANIMKGYWNNEASTREVIRDGWLYTGDLAEMDRDGYIYLKGRKDDIIKHLGHRISPSEIEAVIDTCEDVSESAVVGIYDGAMIKLKAYVVAKDKLKAPDLEKILLYTRKVLPPFKRPQLLELIQELPKTANGKIMRSALRNLSM